MYTYSSYLTGFDCFVLMKQCEVLLQKNKVEKHIKHILIKDSVFLEDHGIKT